MNPLPVIIAGVVVVAVPPLRRRIVPVGSAVAGGTLAIAGTVAEGAAGVAGAAVGVAGGIADAVVHGGHHATTADA